VVLDAAYAEFTADSHAFMSLLGEYPNFVMLRTLSKALGLAGVRCGSLLADPAVVDMLGRVLPPDSFPAPCEAAVLTAMEPGALRAAAAQVDALIRERERMATALADNPRFSRVWPSQANFLLVEATDAPGVVAAAKAGGVLIRDFSRDPATPGCLRITIGNTAENDQLLAALE
jgi:histidinol-phosphate aminotransferase